ncbi:hypothetical protein C8R46DRAFT_1040673 [Mycena filopes]|nr:hypothetical protein C8R46DRAFT_1040673 [Mycena filopes]
MYATCYYAAPKARSIWRSVVDGGEKIRSSPHSAITRHCTASAGFSEETAIYMLGCGGPAAVPFAAAGFQGAERWGCTRMNPKVPPRQGQTQSPWLTQNGRRPPESIELNTHPALRNAERELAEVRKVGNSSGGESICAGKDRVEWLHVILDSGEGLNYIWSYETIVMSNICRARRKDGDKCPNIELALPAPGRGVGVMVMACRGGLGITQQHATRGEVGSLRIGKSTVVYVPTLRWAQAWIEVFLNQLASTAPSPSIPMVPPEADAIDIMSDLTDDDEDTTPMDAVKRLVTEKPEPIKHDGHCSYYGVRRSAGHSEGSRKTGDVRGGQSMSRTRVNERGKDIKGAWIAMIRWYRAGDSRVKSE